MSLKDKPRIRALDVEVDAFNPRIEEVRRGAFEVSLVYKLSSRIILAIQ